MIPKNHLIANKINKPISTVNASALMGAAIGATAATVIDEDDSTNHNNIRNISKYPDTMNLLEFSRLYKLGQIPIIDFAIGYIILYILNSICAKYDHKLILIITVPLVIIFNLLLNPNVKPTIALGIVCIISIYYLLTTKYVHN